MDLFDIIGNGLDWAGKNALPLVGAGASILGGVATSNAAKSAARSQAAAQQQAQANFRPYAELGDQAAGIMSKQLSPNALLRDWSFEDMLKDPGYQFRLSEGEKSIDRNAGARGKRYSGETLKGLQRYAQDYASNEAGRSYDRDANNRQMKYNFLAGPINAGQGASGTLGNYQSNVGDAQAAGRVGSTNALWGGIGDAFSGLNQQNYLQQLMKQYPTNPRGYP